MKQKRIHNYLVIGVLVIVFAGATGYLQLQKATTTVFLPSVVLPDLYQSTDRGSTQISDLQLVTSTPDVFVLRFTEPLTTGLKNQIHRFNVYMITSPDRATIQSSELLSNAIEARGSGKVNEFSIPRFIPGADVAFFVRGVTSGNAFVDSNTVFLLLSKKAGDVAVLSQKGVAQFVQNEKFFRTGCSIGSVKQNRVSVDGNQDGVFQGVEVESFLVGSDIGGDGFCS